MLWVRSSPVTQESRDEALPAASLPVAASPRDGNVPGTGMLMDPEHFFGCAPQTGAGSCPSSPALQRMLQIHSARSGVQRGGGFILRIKGVQPEPRRRPQQEEGDYKGKQRQIGDCHLWGAALSNTGWLQGTQHPAQHGPAWGRG